MPDGQRDWMDMLANQLFDVVEVQIKAPHEWRVMETRLTKENADAYIKMAVIRRGVEHSFYTTQPSAVTT